ncbi:hypothetical protein SAMN04489806_1125 [Paramicrobacterium humi]|uniref:Antitoxin Xre/MbcA/ParS-like toxin-binding domain-containing protein n=1 Tax=Paramicrobacterium humi TaxID=640635 RepID=A0A1H4KFD0_9MICO|nr:hypothetical protein [Microbacterium humi]SEB56642.1 hypothetical protein SAMN04489806_1125 [Microbacterium humi]
MTLSIREITRRLNAGLGPTLVAGLAGAKDARISREWSKHDGPVPGPAEAKQLAFAYEQWRRVVEVEGEQVARLWFTGGNPWLGDYAPVTAIREDRFKQVNAAAQALIDDANHR